MQTRQSLVRVRYEIYLHHMSTLKIAFLLKSQHNTYQ